MPLPYKVPARVFNVSLKSEIRAMGGVAGDAVYTLRSGQPASWMCGNLRGLARRRDEIIVGYEAKASAATARERAMFADVSARAEANLASGIASVCGGGAAGLAGLDGGSVAAAIGGAVFGALLGWGATRLFR